MNAEPECRGASSAEATAVVPARLVGRWEAAYRQYGQASELAARSAAGDPQAAQAVASASLEVAAAWREMTGTTGLPWWALAALRAAADAFEQQARNWRARAAYQDGGSPTVRRPPSSRRRADHG
jgi:hypothetical protein